MFVLFLVIIRFDFLKIISLFSCIYCVPCHIYIVRHKTQKIMNTQKNLVLAEADAVVAKHEEVVNGLLDLIVKKTAEVGNCYYLLCNYIRDQQLTPVFVTGLLKARGFAASRISEIKTVAFSADAVWSSYKAMTIGFRKVLDLERGSVINVIALENVAEKNDLIEGLAKIVSQSNHNTTSDPVETAHRSFERSASVVLKFAATLAFVGTKKWSIGNGYTLTLTKNPSTKKEKSSKNLSGASALASMPDGANIE